MAHRADEKLGWVMFTYSSSISHKSHFRFDPLRTTCPYSTPLHFCPLQSDYWGHCVHSHFMNTTRPGSFQLVGHAYVKNMQPVPGKPCTIILDGYLFGAPEEENNEIVCSLHFFKGEETLVITEGLYDVMATVCFICCHLTQSLHSVALFCMKVIAFRPHVNEQSSIISDDEFRLMGDLTEACSTAASVIWTRFHPCTQLKPIPIATNEAITYNKVPALVLVNGSVSFVDKAHDSFSLTPSQYVFGSLQSDAMPICAVLDGSSPFPLPAHTLPETNNLIGFMGKLLSFEANSDAGTGQPFHAKVSVLSISHLSVTGEVSASYNGGKNRTIIDNEDMAALIKCVTKYAEKTATPGDEKDYSVGVSKGKCKVILSVDGVTGGKAEQSDKKRK